MPHNNPYTHSETIDRPPRFRDGFMYFGRYKGRALSDLPDQYVDWLLSLNNLRRRFRDQLVAEAKRRRDSRPQPAATPLEAIRRVEAALARFDRGTR